MDIAPILFNDAEPFEQLSTSLRQKAHVKSGENWSSGFREEGV